MPPPQIFSLTGHKYGLTVSGVQVVESVPTDYAPIRWDWPSSTTNGGITFTLEDEGGTALPAGSVIRLTDNAANELLFSGVLTNVRQSRGAGPNRYAEVTGTGWGFYLDNRAVVSFDYEALMEGIATGLVEGFGGPLLAEGSYIQGESSSTILDSNMAKQTLRSALDTVETAFASVTTDDPPRQMYADNDRCVHWWSDNDDEATAVGTATSIGDEGSLQPEYLTYEAGSDGYRGLAYTYTSTGTAVGWTGNTGGGWEAGEPSIFFDAPLGGEPLAMGRVALETFHSAVTAITFTTIESTDFRPHQEITVDDSVLTGGAAETFYISDVSGTIDGRNVIEMSVSIGARARSLVQTVAGG